MARHNTVMAQLSIPDFETAAECARRQAAMVGRLEKRGLDVRLFRSCERRGCFRRRCVDACHFAARRRRLKEIPSAYRLLQACDGHLVDISIVHPTWELAIGDLDSFNIPAARQWLYRSLKELPGLVAVGSFEASVNTELNGKQHWAIGCHAISAGASKPELRMALTLPAGLHRPNARPLVLSDVDNLGRQLGYALKYFVEERRAYLNARNGRTQRRHLPLSTKLWAEHDAWLASLPSGARTIAIGCQRRGGKFYPTSR
jgi:hypothetical protein